MEEKAQPTGEPHFVGKKDELIEAKHSFRTLEGRDILVIHHQGVFYAIDSYCYREYSFTCADLTAATSGERELCVHTDDTFFTCLTFYPSLVKQYLRKTTFDFVFGLKELIRLQVATVKGLFYPIIPEFTQMLHRMFRSNDSFKVFTTGFICVTWV